MPRVVRGEHHLQSQKVSLEGTKQLVMCVV